MLSELAGQGFVERVPRRGWQVRPIDANAMLQYLEIHGCLTQQSRNRYIADFFARHSTYYSQLFEMAAVQTHP